MGRVLKMPLSDLWQLFMACQGRDLPELAAGMTAGATNTELVACQLLIAMSRGVPKDTPLKNILATMRQGIRLFFARDDDDQIGGQITISSRQWAHWDSNLNCWVLRFPVSAEVANHLGCKSAIWWFNCHHKTWKRLGVTVCTQTTLPQRQGVIQRLSTILGWSTKKAG